VEGESEGITVVERLLAELAADVDQGRIADGKLLTLVLALRLRRPDSSPRLLFFFCFSRDRQIVMAVRGVQLTYGARRVSRGRFESGVTERSSRNLWMVARGLRLRYSHKRSGRAAPQPAARRRPMSFSAGPWTRPEGRAR
jgi:hypothetical protein